MPTLPFCKTCLDREWWKWEGRAIVLPECACLLTVPPAMWELMLRADAALPFLDWYPWSLYKVKTCQSFWNKIVQPGDCRGDRQVTGPQVHGLPRSRCFHHWPWWAAGAHMFLAPQEMAVWMTDPCGGWGCEISIVIHPGCRSIVNREGSGLNTAGL